MILQKKAPSRSYYIHRKEMVKTTKIRHAYAWQKNGFSASKKNI